MTERKAIVDAFGRRKIRPNLETVAKWQDEARQALAESTSYSSDPVGGGWDQVAVFVVAFEERQGQAGYERRVVAEQTEVEPDAGHEHRHVVNDWTSVAIHEWMITSVEASAPESDAAGELATTVEQTPPIGGARTPINGNASRSSESPFLPRDDKSNLQQPTGLCQPHEASGIGPNG